MRAAARNQLAAVWRPEAKRKPRRTSASLAARRASRGAARAGAQASHLLAEPGPNPLLEIGVLSSQAKFDASFALARLSWKSELRVSTLRRMLDLSVRYLPNPSPQSHDLTPG
jgi:hypothetical protein